MQYYYKIYNAPDKKQPADNKTEALAMDWNRCTADEVIAQHGIPELHSESCLLRHKKTGARIALLSNDDENKVFYIGFRTPPQASTGVAHILEH